jgi:hypothetical protein
MDPISCVHRLSEKIQKNSQVLLFLALLALPLILLTFDTTNWSDDYQYLNLLAAKAKATPIYRFMWEPVGGEGPGGHFGPAYLLINYGLTVFSVDPRWVHLQILFCFILSAFILYRIVDEYSGNKRLALLSAALFSLNYYLSFKALAWNCFHSHATNTLTGALSIYFFLRYFKTARPGFLVAGGVFLLLSILNLESGFIFVPVLLMFVFDSWREKQIQAKKFWLCGAVIMLACLAYPVGSYLSMKQFNPLGHRLHQGKPIAQTAFNAVDVLVKSTGLAPFYYQLVFNPLKEDQALKETMKDFIRKNNSDSLTRMSGAQMGRLFFLAAVCLFLAASLIVLVVRFLSPPLILFANIYLVGLGVYVFIFNRSDIANALGLFASVVLADVILTLGQNAKPFLRGVGQGFLVVVLAGAGWCIVDRFQDCYQKSFFGISPVAIKGPDRIYNEMNRQIGRFIDDGIVFFTHDYSAYHETGGFERIGDMLSLSDFACYNATVFSKEALQSKAADEFKNRSLVGLNAWFIENPQHRKIVVGSKQDAAEYLRTNNIDLSKTEAIYLTPDYQVTRLNGK